MGYMKQNIKKLQNREVKLTFTWLGSTMAGMFKVDRRLGDWRDVIGIRRLTDEESQIFQTLEDIIGGLFCVMNGLGWVLNQKAQLHKSYFFL